RREAREVNSRAPAPANRSDDPQVLPGRPLCASIASRVNLLQRIAGFRVRRITGAANSAVFSTCNITAAAFAKYYMQR
ncbi:MAG: hypothetical protein ABI852_12260, partial [Gemmatimonadaceae bacterium]